MKKLLPLALLLLAGLAGCSTKGPSPAPAPAVDLFLGHWQAENARYISYNSMGTANNEVVINQLATLEVTATTFTLVTVDAKGNAATESSPYTRHYEDITLQTSGVGQKKVYARGLSATNFTLEFNATATNNPYVETFAFHR